VVKSDTAGVLFAAVHLGGAGRAVGIEMNKELCDVQSAAVAAFESSLAAAVPSAAAAASATPTLTSSPITIVHANVSSSLSLVNDADVVVCHSILSFPAKQ
jgi:hypothetical protein